MKLQEILTGLPDMFPHNFLTDNMMDFELFLIVKFVRYFFTTFKIRIDSLCGRIKRNLSYKRFYLLYPLTT
jgi:hypothetical protein